MEQNLQTILDLINADANLSENEKAVIIARLNAADKKMGVDAFRIERGEQLKKTMSVLLEETIEELEQKRKIVEDKNRELEIEGALEKVRTVAMGMRIPHDLLEICKVLFEELTGLGFSELRNAMVNIANDEKGSFLNYDFNGGNTSVTQFSHNSHLVIERQVAITNSAPDALIEHVLTGAELEDFKAFRIKNGEAPDPRLENIPALYYYFYSIGDGSIGISVFSPLTEERRGVLKRFRNVFDLAYRRYLDIRQAEEQARESQIQLALERVRARTMAMQKSAELSDAAGLLFEQIQSLGMPAWSAGYCTWADNKKSITFWMSSEGVLQPPFIVPTTEDTSFVHMREAAERGETFYVEEVGGEELAQHYKYMRTLPVVGQVLDSIIEAGHPLPTFQIFHLAYFTQGFLLFITYQPVPEAHSIFRRFSKVFEQTYTRFLDLQKAEAQTRESQIQLTLERIRARTMAMQRSDELADISLELFKQVQLLGIATWHCAFNIYDEDQENGTEWSTNIGGVYPMYKTPRVGIFRKYYEIGTTGQALHVEVIGEDRCADHYAWLCTLPGVGDQLLKLKASGIPFPTSQIDHVAYFKYGYLLFITYEPAPEAYEIFKRVAKTFEQTYTRFLDLQKAEAQAREAQIQLALERVRARTMAMQRSDELAETAHVLYQQFASLGETPLYITIGIINPEENSIEFWHTDVSGNKTETTARGSLDEPFLITKIYDVWKNKQRSGMVALSGNELKGWVRYRKKISGLKGPSGQTQSTRYVYFGCFSKGVITLSIVERLPAETIVVLERFAAVFDGTYTRFLDLQKTEAQAREAQIQLALERVRARTMAMQKSEELHEVIQLVFDQLHQLNFNIDVANFALNYKKTDDLDLFLAVPHGTYPMKIHVPYLKHPVFDRFNKAKKKGGLLIDALTKVEKDSFFKHFFMYVPGVPEETKAAIFGRAGFVRSSALMNNTALTIHNYDGVPYSEAENDTLLRFGQVFEQTYTRFTDLKQAEAQTRESQIQLALERVRARTMAMQRSEELGEVAGLLFRQVNDLGIETWTTGFNVWSEDNNSYVDYITSPQGGFIQPYTVYATNPIPIAKEVIDARKSGDKFFVQYADGEKLKEMYLKLSKFGNQGQYAKMLEDGTQFPSSQVNHFVFGPKVSLMFITYKAVPEAHEIFKRFGKVFEQTYTRFLDLKQAEEQVRESQIQLALERVRARTMAMQRSEELAETVFILFQQFKELGENPDQATIGIINEKEHVIEYWVTMHGNKNNKRYKFSIDEPNVTGKIYDAWKKRKKLLVIDLSGKPLRDFMRYRESMGGAPVNKAEKRRIINVAFFSKGLLNVQSNLERSEESIRLLERFATVFEGTYTRFLDLQKAEAQAHDAQIQLGLERVRAAAMAMHNSQDVANATALVFSELYKLGINTIRCGVCIVDDAAEQIEVWSANMSLDGKVNRGAGKLDMTAHPLWLYLLDAWRKKTPSFSYELKGKALESYYKAIRNAPNYEAPAGLKPDQLLEEKQFCNCYIFNEGCLFTFTREPFSPEISQVLEKFAAVFGLTYRRYLDLTRAEAQAREAQIEAALERVRGKAMAMHDSNDLSSAASQVFTELKKLGIKPIRCGVGLLTKDSRRGQLYSATISSDRDVLGLIGWVELSGHPVLKKIYDSWLDHEDYFPVLNGKELKSYYEKLLSGLHVPPIPAGKSEEKQFGHFLQFNEGCLYAWAERPYAESELKILDRFKGIISLTFRRYLDLKKAELSAKEAIKQASLDRVRAEIASMRKRSDLERITPLIWDELTVLGIPFIRCGVFIMDEDQKLIHTFLSTPDGKAIGAFHVPFDTSGNFEKMVASWRQNLPYIDHWKEEAFSQFADTLVKQGAITSKAQYMRTLPHGGVHLNFLPFLQGMLYVGNREPLSEDNIDLIQSVAEAFSTAYARYEDFNKLEAAKQQVDNTLTQLKATQSKLIQSEKMASLGELTAGIAHEIQNPLNFVNNFSEVSAELIEEMDEELEKGDIEEAKAIAGDIKSNLEKIRHHGKRADGIVKGMLQHSRASSNVKEPTDINKLADEYLHLAYHGLRAKDKSFNAELITHLDEKLPKASVVPQDIGRVILNMINNAFYATQQKAKALNGVYKPEVTVTTAAENGQVIIKVKDNGNGIPDAIKDKIMQPFFTTKPTGEGTGLGLSLSYDIVVKGHDGKIDVDTKEGEFTELTVSLPV